MFQFDPNIGDVEDVGGDEDGRERGAFVFAKGGGDGATVPFYIFAMLDVLYVSGVT